MKNRYDVIVVGVGAMGAAACFHLARRHRRVLGLEQFGIPHALGSSHGDSRMIRLCYYEHPDYVPLLKRAYALWAQLEQESGAKLLFKTGGIYMGRPDREIIAQTLRAAKTHSLPHEYLDRSQLADRYPQFAVPDDHVGIYEPEAGFLLPESVIAAHARAALGHGADLRTYEPLIEWTAHADHVVARTSKATYVADRIIFCGGPWSQRLLGEIGVRLDVTRQILGWVWPKRPELFAMGALPVWAIDATGGSIHYGFPMLNDAQSGRPGFKVAHHARGTLTTPDTIDRTPQPDDERGFRDVLERYIPQANGPLLSMAVCMYTNSPDSHFIIDRHPASQRAILACGFSGHGFKFASVVGEILADLAELGTTPHPIGFLGLNRFAAKHPTG